MCSIEKIIKKFNSLYEWVRDVRHKHEQGEKVIAMTDNHGYVLAPLPVAPVNETDMVLLPEGLHALKQVAKEVGLELRGA
jgi:hypothetical protein